MNEQSQNSSIEPELEARIVALVLGEASDFETEELHRLIEQRPELAAFMKEMQRVHGLLQTAGAVEFETPDANWKLPTDRRNAVLSVIREETSRTTAPAVGQVTQQHTTTFWPQAPARNGRTASLARRVRAVLAESLGPVVTSVSRHMRTTPARIAAGVCAAGFIGLMTVSSFFDRESRLAVRSSQRELAEASLASTGNVQHRYSVSGGTNLSFQGVPEGDSVPEAADVDAVKRLIAKLEPDSSDNSRSLATALSALQQTLNGGALASNSPDDEASRRSIAAVPRFEVPDAMFDEPLESNIDAAGRPSVPNEGEDMPVASADDVAFPELADTWGGNATDMSEPAPVTTRFRSDALDRAHVLLGTINAPAAPGRTAVGGGVEGSMPQLMREKGEAVGETSLDLVMTDSAKQLEDLPEKLAEQPLALLRGSDGYASKDKSGYPALDDKSDGELDADELKGIEDPGRTKHWEKEPSEEWRKKAGGLAPTIGLNETNAAVEAFSTFSLHVSDVSFKLAAAALARGEWPEAAKIRIEEFVNAFDYGDPLPGKDEKVACVVEQAIHPFVQQRNVLRVSMRTAAKGRAANTPLRLTFVLDNSGSMERIDRQQTVRRAFTLLAQQLSAFDQVTLISFSRQPRLLAENVSGTESGKLVELIEHLPSEGGTNIEAALQLAFEKAAAQQTPGAQNRIVLLTDGAVNLGNADPESLSRMVESMRGAGIAFDAAGISADGLNDEVLEALTRKGDGRYYLLDSGETAGDSFAQQIAGALRPSASNVKVQVEFNPKRVGQYKLLGFEKHLLKQEDFRNDAVDAAEMAAAEAGVALYQFQAKPDGEGDVGSVSVRFRDLSTGQMVEHRWPIPYEPDAVRPDQARPSLRIAASAALLAARLRGEPLGESVDLQALSQLVSGLPEQERSDTRVQQLQQMIEQARQLSGK